MLILALDTTTRGGSVAVTRDDEVLALVPGDATRTHGERIPGEMARALAEAGVTRSAIDLLAVASGPGAFTGLRIGLAAMQGLAMALDRPVVGTPTVDALTTEALDDEDDAAQPITGERVIVPWMDGQRGEVFAALHAVSGAERLGGDTGGQRWTILEDAVVAEPAQLLERWASRLLDVRVLVTGDATVRDVSLLAQGGGGRWHLRVPGPLAPAIARLGWRLSAEGKAGPPHALAPIYARRPDVEIERERRGLA